MPTTVLKVGGALVADVDALDVLWSAVDGLLVDGRVVVVHGGGAHATELARRLGHEPRLVHGRRVTTDLDLDVVQWTMRGELNGRLVARASRHGVRAVGLSGVDGPILRVVKRPPWTVDGESIDFGWVGDVQSVDPHLLDVLIDQGYVPVLAPLGVDASGRLYNVNADTVSCAVASALEADEYVLLTESGGVRRDPADPGSRLEACDTGLFERGLAEGWISDGMRVKLKVAFDALEAGVENVFVGPPEALRDRTLGTRITA